MSLAEDLTTRSALLDVASVRADFPALAQRVHDNRRLVYLDTAASALKPQPVIDAMSRFMARDYANIHRGVYSLSQRSTEAYEAARARVARFVNAARDEEIVFTRNATEAINLVAASWGRDNLREGDEVVITELEHHANIVPWQILEARQGIRLRVVPIEEDGSITAARFDEVLGPRTKLVAISQMSNTLGTVLPVKEIIQKARAAGAATLLDGCQAVCHMAIDVQELGCDFLVFSGHKLYGPTGIGVLWARHELLQAMPPYQGGGDMVEHVAFSGTTFAEPPARFEAGTPAIVEAVGLHAAIDYVDAIGFEAIGAHEAALRDAVADALGAVEGLRVIGSAPGKGAIASFTLGDIHAHDVATLLDKTGVCVRSGHHCTHPLMDRFGVPATVRASFGIYNGHDDVAALVDGLNLVRDLFG